MLESFSGSDSTNAVMKHMPTPVASPTYKASTIEIDLCEVGTLE